FELGTFTGWGTFTNAYLETANPPQFVPNTGNYLVSIFGGFWGVFNASGIFQSFPANPGEVYEIDAWSRHFSGDALAGVGAPNDNWVVMKIAFFDGSQTEIGGVERTILDGTYATDVWHDNQPIRGIAPPGTTSVQPLIIYLQPLFGAGACHVDDLEFRRAFALGLSQDPATLDLSIDLGYGAPFAQFGVFYSFDPANGTMPGMGGTLGGLFIDPVSFNAQLTAVFNQVPPYGGFLDGAGVTSSTIPGGVVAGLTGVTVWGLGAQQLSSGAIDFSLINPYTFQ
ncbi:MAG: hypothetical protein VX913_08165, partial [Planctomycetota bacterium]|nr:hypothetical protein [Planctomycetota bacterium]